ncbi:MAG: hypothetical protein CR962_01180 [Gammaproteobacteria bacterium]|nr:MAG: hypothetical protein CR962_01180 [Gammaproteobacteria bacterium]
MYKSVICAGQGGTFSAYLEVVADGDVSLRRKTAIRSEPEWVRLAGIIGFVETEFFSNLPSSGQAMIQW